jgi:hypothetical protein
LQICSGTLGGKGFATLLPSRLGGKSQFFRGTSDRRGHDWLNFLRPLHRSRCRLVFILRPALSERTQKVQTARPKSAGQHPVNMSHASWRPVLRPKLPRPATKLILCFRVETGIQSCVRVRAPFCRFFSFPSAARLSANSLVVARGAVQRPRGGAPGGHGEIIQLIFSILHDAHRFGRGRGRGYTCFRDLVDDSCIDSFVHPGHTNEDGGPQCTDVFNDSLRIACTPKPLLSIDKPPQLGIASRSLFIP